MKMPRGHEKYLWIALFLTAIFTIVEIIGGLVSGSLALLSDAAHMFTDVASLLIALTAIQISKKPADFKRTFGYYRFEILAAVINAVILLLVAVYIFYEAYHRLFNVHTIQPITMLVIAITGLIVNTIAILLLKSGAEHSLNVQGAYLEAWADLLGSAGVIIAAIIIHFTHWQMVDSIIAIGIGLWVLPRTWTILKESINILLEGVPKGIQIQEIKSALSLITGVLDAHDLHIWAVTSDKISLTVHLVVDNQKAHAQTVLDSARKILQEEFSIYHATIQLETEHCGHDDLDSHNSVNY